MEDSRDYVLMDQINNLYDLLNKEELEVGLNKFEKMNSAK